MPRANSLPRNTLSISVLQALQNTGDKFSNGERSNQIRHEETERDSQHVLFKILFISWAALGEISGWAWPKASWKSEDVRKLSALHPQPSHQKTVPPVRVTWQSYIINVPSTSHTLMHNDSCGEILIYPVLGISVSYTADSVSVSFHCTLKKRRSQTPDNAPCCRLHHDSCIHLQWRKLTRLKHLQRFTMTLPKVGH